MVKVSSSVKKEETGRKERRKRGRNAKEKRKDEREKTKAD